MRNSQVSGRSTSQNNDDTKYTFNPITEKKTHMTIKPNSVNCPKIVPSKFEYKVISPQKWKSGNKDILFSYGFSNQQPRTQLLERPKGDLFSSSRNYNPI